MNKMKSVLGTFLLLSLQSAHSMENKETQFNAIPRGVKGMIFAEVARDSHPETLGDLRLVCKDWRKTVDGKDIPITGKEFKYSDLADNSLWKKCVHAWYGFERHEEALNQFLNGKLVYKPKKDSNDGMIELKISDLRNPFAGQFDLSKCGYVGIHIAIMTGFREQKLEKNKDKVEVWLAPRASIEKFRHSTAKHFEEILTTWDGKTAPLGVFYTWGSWDNLSWYEYLTDKTIDDISNKNLYENWRYSSIYRMDLSNYTKNTTQFFIARLFFELK